MKQDRNSGVAHSPLAGGLRSNKMFAPCEFLFIGSTIEMGRTWRIHLVPHSNLRGKRTIGGGRVEIRNGLFMPILVAKQHNPKIKAFYNRLVESGKPKMVALIAAMRKLLTILNVMLKEGKKWNENTINT